MTVAYDAISNGTESSTTFSFTHTPVGTPRGVIVYVVDVDQGLDQVTSVTYGGTTMTEVAGSPNVKLTGESGGVSAFFLGSSIPTGAQTVTVTLGALAGATNAVCYTVTANADTAIEDTDATINSDSVTNPSATLVIDEDSWLSIGFLSGGNAVTDFTPSTGWTSAFEEDAGITCRASYRKDTNVSANTAAGWTQTSEDAIAISVAIKEAGGAAVTAIPRRMLIGIGT